METQGVIALARLKQKIPFEIILMIVSIAQQVEEHRKQEEKRCKQEEHRKQEKERRKRNVIRRPRGPRSAYIYFTVHERAKIDPSSGLTLLEITKKIVGDWKKLSPWEREKYWHGKIGYDTSVKTNFLDQNEGLISQLAST